VNEIPELNIDLAVTVPVPKEPAKPVRAQNEANDAWTIPEKNHYHSWTQFDISRHVGIVPTVSS